MNEPANPANKQQHTRYSTFARGKLFVGDREVDCTMLNIALGGAKLELAEPVEVNADICVRIDEVGEFSGRVAWRNGANVGIKFYEEQQDVTRIVEAITTDVADYGDRRHAPRTSVLWSGKLHSAGQMVDCTVLNVSAGGAQIRCEKAYEFGLNVILYLDDFGELAGTLIWQKGATLGIAFQNDPGHIARVLGRAMPSAHQRID